MTHLPKDLINLFFVYPVVLCAILLSPFLIYGGIRYRKLQKLEAEKPGTTESWKKTRSK